MALTETVTFRMSLEDRRILELEAAEAKVPFRVYVREKLLHGSRTSDGLAQLLDDTSRMSTTLAALSELLHKPKEPPKPLPAAGNGVLLAAALESLMYWRASVPAQKQQEVRATLESQGLKPWTLPRNGGSNASR